MQKISVNLTNDRHGNKLNYNNYLPAIENKNYVLQKPFKTDFLTVIGNAKLRPLFVLCLRPTQPTTLWPKAPDFAL